MEVGFSGGRLPGSGTWKGELDLTVAGEDGGAFDDVLQFANVARPIVGLQLFDLSGGEARWSQAEFAGGFGEKMRA